MYATGMTMLVHSAPSEIQALHVVGLICGFNPQPIKFGSDKV